MKFAVAAGVLRPGDLVPSVRELSKQLVVNPNTVARAYRDLQTEGLLEPVRGMGLQVAEGAAERCRLARREFVRASAPRGHRGGAAEQAGSGRDRGDLPRGVGQGKRYRRRGGREEQVMTSQANAAIRIENLTKRYRDQVAVDGLSLEVPEGSVFGLLGENGAGKTTTIQILLGLIAADQGRPRCWAWTRRGRASRSAGGSATCPSSPALYDWMTVAEIGWFAAGFHPDGTTGSTAATRRGTPS